VIRIAHVWSTDLGLALSVPHMKRYIDRGWEVYGISPPGPRRAELERAGVHWLPHPLERRLNVQTDALGCYSLYRTFRQHRFHIVHGHNVKTGILARLVAAAARVPVVVQTHHGLIYHTDSPPLLRHGGAALERLASHVSHRTFMQSQDDLRTLLVTGGSRESVLDLIGNGVDLKEFDSERFSPEERARIRAELGILPDEIAFFSAGRLVREKGFLELFEAAELARAQNKKVRLVVAGPEDKERNLGIDAQTLARAQQNGVILLGERKDMARLYAACDVVVLASWREGIARVLMEGAVMGRPLITSDARGCGLVVRPGWGFIVPMKNARALADKLLLLTEESELRRSISEHNRREGRKEYDLERVLGRIEAAYYELLAQRGIVDPNAPKRSANGASGHAAADALHQQVG